MKKLLISLVCCLCLACCVLFGACSGTNGTYKLQKIKYTSKDTEMTVSLGDKFEGMELKEDTFLVIVKGNQAVLRSHSVITRENETIEDTDVFVGTWMEGYENEIYFIPNGEDADDAYIVTKNGKEITIEMDDGLTIYLKK